MSYLANWQHDIFVSYAHGPTRPGFGGTSEDRLSRWSRQLIDGLAEEVLLNLGTKDPRQQLSIWMDPNLGGNQPLTDTLKEKLEQSALLLVVMSDLFLQSAWCRDEVEWFRQSCLRRGETTNGRIFVVRAIATDEARWPPALRDSAGVPLLGYRFHPVFDRQLDEPRPFGWPVPQADDADYNNAISRLAASISRQLKNPNIAQPATSDITQLQGQPPSRTVFLGCMHDTVDEERVALRQRLVAAGITVLPPQDEDPVDEASLRLAFDRHLRRVNAMVLIANEYRGAWPKDQPGGFLSLQIQRAKELGKRCDLWLRVADVAKVRKPEYRQYLETLCQEADQTGVTIRHDDLPGFVDYVVDKLTSVVEPGEGVQTLDLDDAVICANQPQDKALGQDFLETIKATLSELCQESFTFDFADPQEERIKLTNLAKRVRNARTVLVLCFDQDWDWARPFLRLLNGISNVRADGKVRLLVAGPRGRKDASYDARAMGFPTLDGIDKDAEELKTLLRQAIRSGAPRGRPLQTGALRS